MFSSPGMPKIYSTPSFSKHLTRSLAAVDSKCAVMVSPSRECIRWCVNDLLSLAKHMLMKLVTPVIRLAQVAPAHDQPFLLRVRDTLPDQATSQGQLGRVKC